MEPSEAMRKPTLWRHVTGERGINRVRVYERRPGGPLSIEWYDRNGRHQKSLTNLTGEPLLGSDKEHRELAKELAAKLAAELRKTREAQRLRTLKGILMT